jgi:hypothetical protein
MKEPGMIRVFLFITMILLYIMPLKYILLINLNKKFATLRRNLKRQQCQQEKKLFYSYLQSLWLIRF